MNELIDKILDIIGNYRIEDVSSFFNRFTKLDRDHVRKWINQFDEGDREFVLSELLHILPESYLSKENTLRILGADFEVFKKDFGYKKVQDFLKETKFLDCQEDRKSQKILLGFVKNILAEKYDFNIEDCGSEKVKNWLYLDDVLATGNTFKNDIIDKINEYGRDDFQKSGINIISSFFILHSWGRSNISYRIDRNLGYELKRRLRFYSVSSIHNNPRINYYNREPLFNNVYPLECDDGKVFLEFIENVFEREYPMTNENFAFRNSDYPIKETFYSSKENRIRYENIILKKGIDIINSIDNINARNLRPLGITPSSYKTLGTGSHFFTWRNISNTCPLVFWWGANDWHPLFPVKNRGNH